MKRNLLFAHRWLGIVLGVYFVLLGLTGSLLVFGREIDRALNPELLTMPRQGDYQPLSVIVQNFRTRYPDAPMTYVNYPVPPDGVFNIRSGPNQASQLYVYFNPYTGEIIGDRTRIGSLYGFLCYLHFYLLFGQTGWTLNGYGAIFVTMATLLGVWLWWPGRRAGVWKGRFLVRTTAGKSRFLFDLHNVAGIYSIVFAIAFTLTAMFFAFPEPSRKALDALFGSSPDPVFNLRPVPGVARPSLDRQVAAADAAIEGRILRVSFPQRPSDPLLVRKEWDDWNQTRNHAMIAVDPYSGNVLDVYDSRVHESDSIGRLILQWAYPVHFGLWGGLTTRVLYVLLGLVPAVSFATGFWRWRLRRAAERKSAERLEAVWRTASPEVRLALERKGFGPA